MVVLTRDDDEGVGRLDLAGQPFENLRGLTRLVLLVHPVQQRKPVFGGIDQRGLVTASKAGLEHEAGRLDPLAVMPDRPVHDKQIECHRTNPLKLQQTDFR